MKDKAHTTDVTTVEIIKKPKKADAQTPAVQPDQPTQTPNTQKN